MLISATGLSAGATVLDIGAGTGRFSAMLAAAGLAVTAIEPNAAMRAIGIEQTRGLSVNWVDARGESTGLPSGTLDLISYASSLNVLVANTALSEALRLLRVRGWMVCLWNHRDLDDPLQRAVEHAVRELLPDYGYGSRREDPTPLIAAHARFGAVRHFRCRVLHRTSAADFVAGFRAHATLQRQAGTQFESVIDAIAALVAGCTTIDVPFTTNVWLAQRA